MHITDTKVLYSLVLALVMFTLIQLLIFVTTRQKGPDVLEIAQVVTFILIVIAYLYFN